MKGHLTVDLLRRAKEAGAPELVLLEDVLIHLRSRCAQCAAEIAAFEHEGGSFPSLLESGVPELYGDVFDRLTERLRAVPEREAGRPATVEERIHGLLALGKAERERAFGREEGLATFWTWQALVDLASQHGSSPRGEELSALALEVAGALSPEHYGRSLAGDCRALTWATRARSRVSAADWSGVEEALVQAERAMASGSGDPCVAAEIHLVRACWGAEVEGAARAASELGKAAALFREAGEPRLEGEALLRHGLALCELDEVREAARVLDRGLFLFEAEVGPELFARAAAARLQLLDEARPGARFPSGQVH